MPERDVPEGFVSRNEIAELASLFERFEFAFDPRSVSAREAESEFEDRIGRMFFERVQPHFTSVSMNAFRARLKSLCRIYLRACLNNHCRVAQATRLSRPATRRTECEGAFEPVTTAFLRRFHFHVPVGGSPTGGGRVARATYFLDRLSGRIRCEKG